MVEHCLQFLEGFPHPVRWGASHQAIVDETADGTPYWEYRNSDGFDELGYRLGRGEPTKDGMRIVMLGDSVAYGVGPNVRYDYTFPRLMTKYLVESGIPASLYNLAVPGYSTEQERIAFERKGVPVKPDVVVLQMLANDVEEYTIINGRPCDIRLMNDEGGKPAFSFLPLPRRFNQFLFENSAFYRGITYTGMEAQESISGGRVDRMEQVIAEVEKIRVLSEGIGAEFVVALFPKLGKDLNQAEPENEAGFMNRVRRWTRDKGVDVVELRPVLAHYNLEEVRIDRCCHLSEKGHEVVGRHLAIKLRHLAALRDGIQTSVDH